MDYYKKRVINDSPAFITADLSESDSKCFINDFTNVCKIQNWSYQKKDPSVFINEEKQPH